MPNKKKTLSIVSAILILLIIVAWNIFIENCDSFSSYILYKVGLNKPILENMTIEMEGDWYPALSSERGVGKILMREDSSKDHRTIWFNKADGCTIIEEITFNKLTPEKIKSYDGVEIELKKKYKWGEANIIKGNFTSSNLKAVLVNEYDLLISTTNIKTLDEIQDITFHN